MPTSTFTYKDLYLWAGEHLPYWQQDALRRVVAEGELRDADIDELAELAKADRPGPTLSASTIIRVRAPEAPPPAVSVLELRDFQRVNALSDNSIRFAPEGLTIVYGDNAAGKSGVSRVLKKACWAADPGGRILPSVHEPDPDEPAEALIRFSVDGQDRELRWREGQAVDDDLGTVHVFDIACAHALVEKPNKISYTPEILQGFQGLVRAVDRVARKLRRDKAELGNRAPELSGALAARETETAAAIAGISRFTSSEQIESMCTFSGEDASRLSTLDEALKEDPAGRARALDERVSQCRALVLDLTAAQSILSDSALTAFREAHEKQRRTAETAETARAVFASNSELPDVGSDSWRDLWETARRYSEDAAYPGQAFPVAIDDARCVLCQQPLALEAAERLTSFETFVTSDVQQKAETARADAGSARERLEEVALPLSSHASRLLGFQRGSQEQLVLKQFIVRAKLRRRRTLRAREYPDLPDCPDLATSISALQAQATTIREALDETRRSEMAREKAELEDQRTLSPLKEAIEREVARLRAVQHLESLISDCDTGRITRKAREAAKLIVTGRLRSAFATNLTKLEFATAGVDLSLGAGERAVHPYEMKLMERPDIGPGSVLSEGERTCVALAGFLAETEATGSRSGIFLDDPVTSLDHRYRDAVAARLTEEATQRPVTVFTHDVVFLYMLRKHASEKHVKTTELSLERGHRKHGVVRDGPPWIALPVSRRLKRIADDLRKAENFLKEERRDDYELHAAGIYRRLRQTWERAIEEVLLNLAVQRFSTDIQTNRLTRLSDITDDDIQTVTNEMTRCSNYIHDDPAAVNRDIPEPAIVREHIENLESWIEQIAKRRR